MLLDGTEGQRMLDNVAVDTKGHVYLQEDPGPTDHLAKIWRYDVASDQLSEVSRHAPNLFTPGSADVPDQRRGVVRHHRCLRHSRAESLSPEHAGARCAARRRARRGGPALASLRQRRARERHGGARDVDGRVHRYDRTGFVRAPARSPRAPRRVRMHEPGSEGTTQGRLHPGLPFASAPTPRRPLRDRKRRGMHRRSLGSLAGSVRAHGHHSGSVPGLVAYGDLAL